MEVVVEGEVRGKCVEHHDKAGNDLKLIHGKRQTCILYRAEQKIQRFFLISGTSAHSAHAAA